MAFDQNWNHLKTRIVGVVIRDHNILLIRRVKNGDRYYCFPGGSIEDGENEREALGREIREETRLTFTNSVRLFEMQNEGRLEVYYLITTANGSVQLGDPEKGRMDENNQYYLEWVETGKISHMENLLPKDAVKKLLIYFADHDI